MMPIAYGAHSQTVLCRLLNGQLHTDVRRGKTETAITTQEGCSCRLVQHLDFLVCVVGAVDDQVCVSRAIGNAVCVNTANGRTHQGIGGDLPIPRINSDGRE